MPCVSIYKRFSAVAFSLLLFRCAAEMPQNSTAGVEGAADAGKVLVEQPPCDIDVFMSTSVSRCVEYRSGTCHDYIYKNGQIEDRGSFSCSFKLVSGNAEKKDRTRIKLEGGTIKYDIQFNNGFNEGVCANLTSTSMQSGDGRWVIWQPSANTCARWAGNVSGGNQAPAQQTTQNQPAGQTNSSVDPFATGQAAASAINGSLNNNNSSSTPNSGIPANSNVGGAGQINTPNTTPSNSSSSGNAGNNSNNNNSSGNVLQTIGGILTTFGSVFGLSSNDNPN